MCSGGNDNACQGACGSRGRHSRGKRWRSIGKTGHGACHATATRKSWLAGISWLSRETGCLAGGSSPSGDVVQQVQASDFFDTSQVDHERLCFAEFRIACWRKINEGVVFFHALNCVWINPLYDLLRVDSVPTCREYTETGREIVVGHAWYDH